MSAVIAKYLAPAEPALVRGFELLALSPRGVPKLKELVLALAVRGKLVRQVPGEEQAAHLLVRVRASPVEGGRGYPRTVAGKTSTGGDALAMDLPLGWEWVALSEITHNWGQKTPGATFTYIDVASVDNERGVITGQLEILTSAAAPSRARKVVKRGTVIFSTVRPYLKNIAIVERDYEPEPIASTAFAILHPTEAVDARYLTYWLKSDVFTAFVSSKSVGVAYPAINDSNLFEGSVALPPLAEQHRIVAEVEQLLKLCDALEQDGRLADAQHTRLTSALFDALAASESADTLTGNWQRVAEHFDVLLDRQESIEALEQTILRLAVRGLLVSQDDADEAGSDLLKRIAAYRVDLQGHAAKAEPISPDQEAPFTLPHGWVWTTWESVALQIGDIDHKMPREVATGVPYISPRDFTEGNGINFEGAKKISEADYEALASKIRPERGDLIYPRYGTIGKVRLVETDQRFLASYSCAIIKCLNGYIEPRYQLIVSVSPLIVDQATAATNKTTQPNVGLKSIKSFLFPLPPLAEQRRIVARVEELRQHCTDLLQCLTQSRETQSHLADALVAKVGAA